MSFRPLFPVLLAGALAACSTTVVVPSEGTGTSSSSGSAGSGTASSSGSSGMPISGQTQSDVGACGLAGASAALGNQTIYDGALDYAPPLSNVINLGTEEVWSAVITDQATYQPFQDYGLPAVDFSSNAVFVTAATNPCGGNVTPSGIATTDIDGNAHLEVTYSLLSGAPYSGSGPCICENLSYYSLLAVVVYKGSGTPTICVHEVTGC
jgi:hypothetical protein